MQTESVRPIHFGKLLPPPYAGVEAHVDMLLRALHPEVTGTLVSCGNPLDAQMRRAEFPYRLIVERFYGHAASAPIAPGMVAAVRRELASGRCNLLHLHAPNPLGDIAGLLCAGKAPVVMSWHSDVVRQRKLLRLYGPVQHRIIDRADRIIVFTPKHFESSLQLRRPGVENKLHVIPLGFDFSRLEAAQADQEVADSLTRFAAGRPIVLTVGRHVYYKGYEYLLAAFAKLATDAVLVMIGTGPLGPALQAQSISLGIAARVLFAGEVSHAALVAAYRACDVFTLPSIEASEAFGMASAEAMACGKPTVVCELGNGVNYLNQSGHTSLVVPPRDVPALADVLDTLLRGATLRERMGTAAREWVMAQFDAKHMAARTISLYNDIL